MGYVDPFGGSPVKPADVSYVALSLTANTTLEWPSLTSTGTTTARIMDINCTVGSLTLTLPAANQAEVGADLLVRNTGSQTFTLADNGGNTLTTIGPGIVDYAYLTDNSTVAGTWSYLVFGAASAAAANAATLQGYGIKAIGGTLNADHPYIPAGAPVTIGAGSRAQLYVDSAGVTFSLPAAATATAGFFFLVRNASGGNTTIDPNGAETIDGVSTVALAPDESCLVACTGAEWYTVGRGRSTTFAYSQLVKDVTGSIDVTLSGTEAGYKIVKITGALGANINLIFPNVVSVWYFDNSTTGGYTVTCKTAAGTGVSVAQNNRVILYGDGTDVLDAQTVFTSSGTFSAGSAANPSITFAGDTDTGFYNAGANQIGFAVNGVYGMALTTAGLTLANTLAVAYGGTGVTTSTGTGNNVLSDNAMLVSPTMTTPVLGTPTSGTLTNCTGLPVGSGISGLGANVATFLATPSSANLAAALTDETGTGAAVFANTPTLVTPILGTPTSGDLTNCTNAVAYGLKSATTTVSVSAATAPTSGQVLTATSSTTATWQTPGASAAAASTLLMTNQLFGGI